MLLLVSACGSPTPAVTPAPSATSVLPQVGCTGIPATRCEEVARGIAANGSRIPPLAIVIACGQPAACGVERGMISVDVEQADGQHSSKTYVWISASAPLSGTAPVGLAFAPTCVGIDAGRCRTLAEDAAGDRAFPPPIRSIVVTCKGTCVSLGGHGATVITYEDGTEYTRDWAYQSAP